jgi:phosphoglucomutase
MQTLIGTQDRFDVAFACDTDHDRHGIVTRNVGLLPPNHYLAVAIDYLYRHRPRWPKHAAVGKTIVCSQIDRVAAKLGRGLYEAPVGFKWFVEGLLDGKVWTTDKDGIVPALLAAEITVRVGRDPGEIYRGLAHALGEPVERRVQATATLKQRKLLARLSPRQFRHTKLAEENIERVLDRAPGNDVPFGGLKVITKNGWFAARPSGTENIYKIYAESFRSEDHLERIVEEAQAMIDSALGMKRTKATAQYHGMSEPETR